MKYQYFLLLLFLQAFVYSSCNYDGISERNSKISSINSVINKEVYKKDSVQIVKQLEVFLKGHKNFFFSKEYYDSTQLLIDSIIYSPELNKLAIFVITKNPIYRQLVPAKEYKWYYNANCYLGIRQNDTIILSSIGPRFRNSVDKDKLIKMMRNTYFSKYAGIKNSNGSYKYKFNLGDIRFWDSPIWQEIGIKNQKKNEFDEYKINHPDDVYDPASADLQSVRNK